MAFKTTIKDKGYKKVRGSFDELKKKPFVKIGVLEKEGDHTDSPLSVAEVATFNEFGTETIPERSFMRSTLDQNDAKYRKNLETLHNKVILQQMTPDIALGILGEQIQSDIIATINSGVDPENSPATIAKKGSSKTLVDSGQLKQSIRYEVTK